MRKEIKPVIFVFLILCVGNWGCKSKAKSDDIKEQPLKVIFETDLGNDIDDALALDILNAINLVRTRAKASILSGYETTEEIRELVYTERLKELSGELHEYFDIQRLERLEDNVTNSYEAQLAGVQFDLKQYLYPIPQDEIDVNLGIDPEDQNPGYQQLQEVARLIRLCQMGYCSSFPLGSGNYYIPRNTILSTNY